MMTGFRFPIVRALTWLYCAHAVVAAPPPSLTLTSPAAFNRTVSFAGHDRMNVSRPPVGPLFPPRADLPDVFFYDVPFSDPLMNIKFYGYTYIPERNETECEKVFRAAIRFATDPRHHPDQELDPEEYEFDYGDQRIAVSAVRAEDVGRHWILTYRLWATALTGLNNFRLAYLGLYFMFEVFIYPGEEEPELYIAIGEFWSSQFGRTVGAAVL